MSNHAHVHPAFRSYVPIKPFQFFQANCKLNQLDNEGRSCLTHARNSGAKEVCDLLVSAGCMDSSSGGTLPRRRGSVSGIATGKPQGRSKEVASSVL